MEENTQDSTSNQHGQHKRTKAVINRLSRIEGHVKAIKRMIQEDKSCPDVLIQLAAVKSAIQKTSQIVLEDHMESCLSQAVEKGETDQEWDSLKEALHRYIG